MFDYRRIVEKFEQFISWLPDPTGTVTVNTWTDSNVANYPDKIFFNDFHPLLSFENIYSIAPELDSDLDFDSWLGRVTNGAIKKSLHEWLIKKAKVKPVTSPIRVNKLFNELTSAENESFNPVNFGYADNNFKGGFLIDVKHDGVKVTISNFRGKHSGASGDENYFRVFKIGRTLPIVDEYIVNGGFHEDNEPGNNIVLTEKGRYFLYTDFSANDNTPIIDAKENIFINNDIVSFTSVSTTDTATDINPTFVNQNSNWGLNFTITETCDYTDLIISNMSSFVSLIGLGVAREMLRRFAFNPEALVNRNEANFNINQILYEIDGDSQGESKTNLGLRVQYYDTLNSIAFNENSVISHCINCKKKGVKYRSV